VKATHIVLEGKLRINAWLDMQGDTDILRAIHDDSIVATMVTHKGKVMWNKPVVAPKVGHPGQWDHIKSLGNPAVTMTWDGIFQGRYF
jgi:hypothetical protein